MKVNSFLLLSLIILSLSYPDISGSGVGIKRVPKDTITVNSPNHTLSAKELFQLDPTNPTQILKQQWREKNSGIYHSPVIAQSSKTFKDELNQKEDFWIISSFTSYPYQYVQISATLLAIGDNSYIYVADSIIQAYGSSYSQTLANNWRAEFENKIYPNDVRYFGSPDGTLGDVDGDPHVTILLCELNGGVAGYFDPSNEFPSDLHSNPYSNQREMVYVDHRQDYGVLAHEFQHLIHFNYDQNEVTFVDEGCAELARYLSGYVLSTNLTVFARDYFAYHPEDSLLYWNYYSEENLDVRIDYGGAYMFLFYLAEKYGVGMIRDLVANKLTGALGIESSLKEAGYDITFNQLYLNWITALTIDQPFIDDGLYGFRNVDIDMSKDYCSAFPANRTYFHRYYGFHITKLDHPADFMIVHVSPPVSYYLGVSVAVLDTNGWHITTELLTDNNIFYINGTEITAAYVISALMKENTPIVTAGSDFGVGDSENLTFSFIIGKPLYITNFDYSYFNDNWTLNIENTIIVDSNNTQIVSGMNVTVSVVIINTQTAEHAFTFALNYSTEKHWNAQFNLQFMDEGTYDVIILAKGYQYWGQKNIGTITIAHIITVTTPNIRQINDTSIKVTVNASYTQFNGYDKFIQNANFKMSLYRAKANEIVTLFDLHYDSNNRLWTTGELNLAKYGSGDYYVVIKVLYNGRVVNSDQSIVFHIVGSSSNNTGTVGLSTLALIGALTTVAITLILVKKKKKL